MVRLFSTIHTAISQVIANELSQAKTADDIGSVNKNDKGHPTGVMGTDRVSESSQK